MAGDVRFIPNGAALVAEVNGEVDDLTARPIGAALIEGTRQAPCHGLVIDLRPVTFLSSAGLSMLLDVRGALNEQERETHLLCESGSMPQRLLRITSLDDLFPVHTLLRDALDAVDGTLT
jgi:anti-anti-sigma factor